MRFDLVLVDSIVSDVGFGKFIVVVSVGQTVISEKAEY